MKDDRPSLTAVLVAYCVLILGGDDWGRARIPPGIVAAQVAVLVAANLPFGTCPWVLCNPVVAKLARFLAAIWYPGFFEGIGFRKLIIECQARDFLRQSALNGQKQGAQVVVVAAGYDTLAVRLCREYGQVQFWEVDHPATSGVKSRVWTQGKDETILGDQPSNMHHVKADLTKVHLDSALQARKEYNPNLPTIVIVEGLSMYLTEPQMRGLLDDIGASMTKGGSVVFDFFGWNARTQQVDVGTVFPAMHRYGFTGSAEPWIWGLDPNRIQEFLANTHWKLQTDVQSCGFENVAALEWTAA